MKPEWKSFLTNRGAEFARDEDMVGSFGNPERELQIATTGTVICDLSHTGLIAAQGEDAATLLQGQFTNDVRLVTDQCSQLSAYCSPKGRMLAAFRLFKREDVYYLELPDSVLEAVLKRLRMFVLRSKVSLEDASDRFVRIGLAGANAEAELQTFLGGVPFQVDAVLQTQGLTVLRLPGLHPRFEIVGDNEAMQKLWSALDVRGAPVGADAWRLLDILAGVPSVHPETSDAFVPQMANLQLINGVNFKKGCYAGQEVVARMQYLGKLKRRMYRAHVDVQEAPKPGDAVFAKDSTSGQGTGKIVDAAPSPDGGFELLAVIEIASREAGEVTLGSPDGPVLRFEDLPYSFEAEKTADRA